jgi:hypothetical protein
MATYFLVPVAPQHEHDCDDCTFLGRMEEVDLWVCEYSTRATYIARYSSEPSDNASTPAFIVEQLRNKVNACIWEAYQRHQLLKQLKGEGVRSVEIVETTTLVAALLGE